MRSEACLNVRIAPVCSGRGYRLQGSPRHSGTVVVSTNVGARHVHDEERAYLLAHTWVSSAKWLNITPEPEVGVSIPDGRVNLVVYGIAETIDTDPERAELSAGVLAVVLGEDRPDPSAIVPWLDQDNRGIVRITPAKALFHPG